MANISRHVLFLAISFSFLAIPDLQSVNAQEKAKPRRAKTPSPVLAPIEDVDGLPRVLLIGDSISMGYTIPVREKLTGKANVHRPGVNCGPTTTGLKSIDQWLGDEKWDVIHFNWGLHDLKYVGEDGSTLQDIIKTGSRPQISIEDYEKNLRQLVERLKQTGAHLIWRNTTPVPAGSNGRKAEDAERYNAVATKVMKENSIQTHDMYSFVKPKMQDLMLPNGNVHFTAAGSDALADEVVNVILAALKTK